MVLIHLMCMPLWTTGIRILIQFQLLLNLSLHPVVCKIQDQIGLIKVQKDQTQLIINNITLVALFQIIMGGTPILFLKNLTRRQMRSIGRTKNGRRIFQLGQIQQTTNNTTIWTQCQTCKLTQVSISLH